MTVLTALFDSPAELGLIFLTVFFAAIMGLIGYLIGRGKGRGVAGFWLGAILGCIGWVIVAVLSPVNSGAASAPAVDQPAAAGWFQDPFRRFQVRYFDGTAWTDQVSTEGRSFTDPPTP